MPGGRVAEADEPGVVLEEPMPEEELAEPVVDEPEPVVPVADEPGVVLEEPLRLDAELPGAWLRTIFDVESQHCVALPPGVDGLVPVP